MGESSACLLRSFSQPSPTSQESTEDDPIRQALTSSVSFGRFVSESLAWEKWSSFSQNRYLEEAEKYSKPGSVAEKKAYFEAHYKKIAAKKAAALVEQQIPAVDDISVESTGNENDDNSPTEMDVTQENDHTEIAEMQGENTLNTDVLFFIDANQHAISTQTDGAGEAIKHPICTEKNVESSNELQVDADVHDEKEVKISFEDQSTMGDSAPSDKDKAAFSSGKSSAHDRGSKIRSSIKPNIPIYPRKGDHAINPFSKKAATQSSKKKRLIPQSLHMSISFTSRAYDTNKTSSPVSMKIVDSGLHKTVARTSEESSNRQTLTRASVGGMLKHLTVIPQLENCRTKTLLDQSISGNISRGRKSNSSLMHIAKSKPSGESKVKSPIVYSSFSLRSEERAAKRKEFFQKLEQKLNAKDAEKEQLQSKQKGKAKGGSTDVWKPVSSLVEANANFHSDTESASIATKKISKQSYLPKIERKLASEVQDSNSRPPWRLSTKTDSFRDMAEKSSTKVILKKSMLENTSPNIQIHMYKGCSKTNACRRSMKE